MRLWQRKHRVTVDTVAVTDNDVAFKIKRSLYQRAGTCEVTLWNLNPSHRAELGRFRRLASDGVTRNAVRVRVEAGHEDGMSVLFQGDATRIWNVREQPDWLTKVTAGDGIDALRNARASRSFAPETTLQDVAEYLVEAMGVGAGNLREALRGATLDRAVGAAFLGGHVVHGRGARELAHLMRSAGYEWSIQDGVLQVLPRGGALSRPAVLLSPDTGLVDAPEVGVNRIVTCKALIQPDLSPGGQVKLESAVISGFYRIESAEYSGESRGADWTAALVLRQIRRDGTLVGLSTL